MFASEIKGIPKSKSINNEAINVYKSLGYIPAPITIYKDIASVCAGIFIEFSLVNENNINQIFLD